MDKATRLGVFQLKGAARTKALRGGQLEERPEGWHPVTVGSAKLWSQLRHADPQKAEACGGWGRGLYHNPHGENSCPGFSTQVRGPQYRMGSYSRGVTGRSSPGGRGTVFPQ